MACTFDSSAVNSQCSSTDVITVAHRRVMQAIKLARRSTFLSESNQQDYILTALL